MAQRGNISPDVIAGIEKTLSNNDHPDFDIKKILIDKGKKDLVIQVNKVTRKKPIAQYFIEEKTDKERIVLHFTMGQIEGDLNTLTGVLHFYIQNSLIDIRYFFSLQILERLMHQLRRIWQIQFPLFNAS
jgi:hypothetical protein